MAFLRRIAEPRGRAATAAALIIGIAGDLAARRRHPVAHGGKGHASHHDRAHGHHKGERDDSRGEDRDRGRDDSDRQEGQHHQHGARAGTHHSGAGDGNGHGHHGHASHAGAEAKQTPTPTPTSTPKDHGGGGGGGGGAGDGKGHGNAGSAFFDSPLATKARRRANDFTHHDGGAGSQTHGISVSSGPDGTDIQTRNITYHAAPNPTPTPFPRLTLPGQEAEPGDGVPAATPAASGRQPADTSGGDTATNFMS